MRLKPSQESLERKVEPEGSSGGSAATHSNESHGSHASNEPSSDDGLDALASELRADESSDARDASTDLDDEVDLATLAAVAGSRTSTTLQDEPSPAIVAAANASPPGETSVSPAVAAPVSPAVAAPVSPAVAAPAPASASSSKLIPILVVLALGLGVGGFVLGRTSRDPSDGQAQTGAVPQAEAAPAQPAQPAPPIVGEAAPSVPARATPAIEPTQAEPRAVTAPAIDSNDKAQGRAPSSRAPDAPAAKGPVTSPAPAVSVRNDAPVLRVQPSASGAQTAPSPAAQDGAPTPFDLETAALATVKTDQPSSGNRSVDALLDDALENPADRKQRLAEVPAEASLPDAPSREEVTQTMTVLLPAIRGCAMGQTGIAAAGIVVRGDGRVASVELSGAPFAGTATGRCMEGVIRRARFSRFRQPTFRVRFPFAIQ